MNKRNTIQKKIVLETLREMGNHPTAEMVYARINEKYPSMSRATVFRDLKSLAEDGTILHVPMFDSADRFDHTNTEHYHFKCTKCNNVFDVNIPYFDDIEKRITDMDDFLIKSHSIVFSGLCPECLKEDKSCQN
ncbi:MAG: transcriptional repressor [Ruminococcus sp.]|nr:transcriptional repressor [Ruminococcus sp.]